MPIFRSTGISFMADQYWSTCVIPGRGHFPTELGLVSIMIVIVYHRGASKHPYECLRGWTQTYPCEAASFACSARLLPAVSISHSHEMLIFSPLHLRDQKKIPEFVVQLQTITRGFHVDCELRCPKPFHCCWLRILLTNIVDHCAEVGRCGVSMARWSTKEVLRFLADACRPHMGSLTLSRARVNLSSTSFYAYLGITC